MNTFADLRMPEPKHDNPWVSQTAASGWGGGPQAVTLTALDAFLAK